MALPLVLTRSGALVGLMTGLVHKVVLRSDVEVEAGNSWLGVSGLVIRLVG